MSRRARKRQTVAVRVPEEQRPFYFLPGPHGGWFVNVLWEWGDRLQVAWSDVAAFPSSGKNGSVLLARRMGRAEEKLLLSRHGDADDEVHGHTIVKAARWRPGRR